MHLKYPNEYSETAEASAASVTLKKADSGSSRTAQVKAGLPKGRPMKTGFALKRAADEAAKSRSEPASAAPQATRRAVAG
jgi:hypothetical protein